MTNRWASASVILSLKAGILSLPCRVIFTQSASFFRLALRLSVKSKPASGRGVPLLSRPLPFTPWQRAQALAQDLLDVAVELGEILGGIARDERGTRQQHRKEKAEPPGGKVEVGHGGSLGGGGIPEVAMGRRAARRGIRDFRACQFQVLPVVVWASPWQVRAQPPLPWVVAVTV